jgi:hypothetical protein
MPQPYGLEAENKEAAVMTELLTKFLRRSIPLLFAAVVGVFAYDGQAQPQPTRWSATSGDVSLSSTGYIATIQQPTTGQQQVQLEYAIVYCSVSCTIAQYAMGTAATATAGTINPIIPSTSSASVTATFWTASNVGTGTQQGGTFHLQGPGTQTFCLNTSCGAIKSVSLPTTGTGSNYSVSIASLSGTVNITVIGESY